jgi:hypothetical protein
MKWFGYAAQPWWVTAISLSLLVASIAMLAYLALVFACSSVLTDG